MSMQIATAACFASGCLLVLLGGWSGCGGTAVIDGEPGAGGATTSTTTTTTTTSSSTTSSGSSSGQGGAGGCTGEETCPAEPPVHGGDCACFAGLKCAYTLCSTSGDVVTAECGGSVWVVDAELCGQIYCPNNILCGENEVCLISSTGFTVEFSCEPNPCSNGPLSCDCAQKLCEMDFLCTEAQDGQVSCECINC